LAQWQAGAKASSGHGRDGSCSILCVSK